MSNALTIAAPFSGTVVAIESVPDEVFAQAIVGPGVALLPEPGLSVVEVKAPISGVITAVFTHAFAIDTADGLSVLVHLGIDTVMLKGSGFTLKSAVGNVVSMGDTLIEWNPHVAAAAGYSLCVPIVAVQADPEQIELLVQPDEQVTMGQSLIHWSA